MGEYSCYLCPAKNVKARDLNGMCSGLLSSLFYGINSFDDITVYPLALKGKIICGIVSKVFTSITVSICLNRNCIHYIKHWCFTPQGGR